MIPLTLGFFARASSSSNAGPTDRPALIEGVALRARDISLISSGKGSLNPIP
jgi:hypothetical protein